MCHFTYNFHMEHERSEKWPIFGEHVTPLCHATPQIETAAYDNYTPCIIAWHNVMFTCYDKI